MLVKNLQPPPTSPFVDLRGVFGRAWVSAKFIPHCNVPKECDKISPLIEIIPSKAHQALAYYPGTLSSSIFSQREHQLKKAGFTPSLSIWEPPSHLIIHLIPFDKNALIHFAAWQSQSTTNPAGHEIASAASLTHVVCFCIPGGKTSPGVSLHVTWYIFSGVLPQSGGKAYNVTLIFCHCGYLCLAEPLQNPRSDGQHCCALIVSIKLR